MYTRNMTVLACSAALLGLVIASSGHARSIGLTRMTHLTFSGPVSLPGVTLARGTYTFLLIPLQPDIVRVQSRDGSRVYFTGFARQVDRPAGLREDVAVTFTERPANVAARIKTWYPIGMPTGREFIY
jgi:hypothetical protein